MTRRTFAAAAMAVLSLSATGAVVADGSTHARSYRNCDALHRVYPHGVGRSNAHDKTSGTPVTSFTRSNKVYSYNDGNPPYHSGERDLDRDNDGIACEKR